MLMVGNSLAFLICKILLKILSGKDLVYGTPGACEEKCVYCGCVATHRHQG